MRFTNSQQSPLVSVIIPVYNAEGTLRRAVASVLKQGYPSLECLLVDDGSTDSSAGICQELASDPRVRVIHQSNGGVSAARNAGLALAQGEYLQFVDADDEIVPNMVSAMVAMGESADADIVICGYRVIDGKDLCARERLPPQADALPKDEFLILLPSLYENILLHSPWNKLYRHKLVRDYGISFDTSRSFGEDLLFNIEVMARAQRFALVRQALYNYYVTGSTIQLSKRYPLDRHQLQLQVHHLLVGLYRAQADPSAPVAELTALARRQMVLETIPQLATRFPWSAVKQFRQELIALLSDPLFAGWVPGGTGIERLLGWSLARGWAVPAFLAARLRKWAARARDLVQIGRVH